jgi:hypothetical protein
MKKRPPFIIMQNPLPEEDESGEWSKLGIKYGTRTPVRAAAAKPTRARRSAKDKTKGGDGSTVWLKHVAGIDYYPGFSVASADLTDDEAEQLCKLDKVKEVVPDAERLVPKTQLLGPQITPSAKTGKAGFQDPGGKRFINLDLPPGGAWMPLHANGGMLPLDLSTGTVRPFDQSGVVLPFSKSGVKLPFGGSGTGGSGVVLPFDKSGVILPFDQSGVPLPFDKSGVKLPFGVAGIAPVGSGLLHYALGSIDAMQQVLQRFGGTACNGSGNHSSTAAATGSTASQHVIQSSPDLTWNLAALGIRARDRGGKNIRIAVLDTGIDLNHPDFAPLKAEKRLICKNFTTDGRKTDVTDRHGHGTHCCGIIAGPAAPLALSELPRYAIAPEVTLLVGKVLDDHGKGSDSTVSEGISWAVRNGAQIICLSLGEPRGEKAPYSSLYEKMAEVTTTTATFNALLVSAAGNFSNLTIGNAGPIANPAACPSFMAVGAVNSRLQLCDFSSVQCDDVGLLDLCAPGEAILSTAMGGGYELRSGTSMAAPHVAAVAALYLQQNPGITLNELWNLLERRATALGSPRHYGRGMVRAV